MKVRSLISLLGLSMLVGASAQAAVDKAVYYDTTLMTVGDWMHPDAAKEIKDYFEPKGYKILDYAALATFMTTHTAAKDTSVVIFASDIMPDNVMPGDAITDPKAADASVFNQYLKAGGKVVYLGDWPAYYQTAVDGTRATWNDTGAQAALGFWPAKWDYADVGGTLVFTEEGKKWGLTKAWASIRPTDSNEVGLILGRPGSVGRAVMPWVKQYAGRPGSGFTYLYDKPLLPGELKAEDFAQIQSVTEYFPAGDAALSATISGKATGSDGAALAGQVIKLIAEGVIATTKTDDAGHYSFFTLPGTYSVTLGSTVAADPATASVTVAANDSKTADLAMVKRTDLSSAGGQTWEIKAIAPPASGATPHPTDDPKSIPTATGFVAYTTPGTGLDDLTPDGDVYAWIRTKVTLTDDMVGKDLALGDWNVDDVDEAYWNGEFIGSTSGAGTRRYYTVPGRLVQKSNDLVILAHDTGGPGGMTDAAPKLWAVRTGGEIRGVAKNQKGEPQSGMTITAEGTGEFGKQSMSVASSPTGNFVFSGLGAGTYTISSFGGLWGTAHPASKSIAVTSGGSVTQDIVIVTPSTMSFRAADLAAAGLPGWAFLQTQKTDAPLFGTVTADGTQDQPDPAFMAKWCTDDLVTTGASALVPGASWLQDWDLVPGTAGPAGRNGDADGIPDLSYWVQALRFKVSGEMATQKKFAITDFNVNDNFEWMCVNGTRIYGRPDADYTSWPTNRQMEMPSGLIKTDGSDNIAVIVGYSLGGNAGHSSDFGGPRLVGAGASSVTVVKGDLNGDGKVNIADATMALQFAVGNGTPTADQLAAGDVVGGDGKIGIPDVTKILQAAIGAIQL